MNEYRFRWRGDEIRVVVAGDVLALPDERWSMGNFGTSISVEWLLHSGKLPGSKLHREGLAACLVRALAEHHKMAPEGSAVDLQRATIHGPQVPCRACGGSGFAMAAICTAAGYAGIERDS